MERKKFLTTRTMILCALFAALVAIGAFIRIPLPVTVFTMQFIFVLLSGLLLGSKRGGFSVFLYIFIGLIGFPVFTEGGGPAYILKPTFGYLIAFIVAAYFVGYVREKFGIESFKKLFLSCLISLASIYLFGSFYTYIILNYVMSSPISYLACLLSLFPITAIKDIVSCFIAVLAAQKMGKSINFNQ